MKIVGIREENLRSGTTIKSERPHRGWKRKRLITAASKKQFTFIERPANPYTLDPRAILGPFLPPPHLFHKAAAP